MLNQAAVDRWLEEFLQALRDQFGDRLIYVGHHGSWARGEGRPDSDIDTCVVLDCIQQDDLDAYKEIVGGMLEAERVASGVLLSVDELQQWDPGGVVQFFHGRNVLHGSADGLVEPPGTQALIQDIRLKASDNLIAARHYMLYPHDRSRAVHRLMYPFKACFFALQAWILVRDGKFIGRKADMLDYLSDPTDREVVEVVRDWHGSEQDRTERPDHYIALLERWSRGMLERLAGLDAS